MTDKRWKLPRSLPESQGVDPTAVEAFLDAIRSDDLELHSLMIVRRGAVIAEGWWTPYAPDVPHVLFSLSKSFCSTAVGFAVAEGLLSIDERVVSHFPDELPAEVSQNLSQMRIRDLLDMSTGHADDTTGSLRSGADDNWARAFLALPVQHEPGLHFLYNTGATYMLSAIVHRLTGQRLVDYLRPRLFDPLGIGEAVWDTCPRGIDFGGSGLRLTTEDIAKFGQLLLLGGRSPRTGEQIVDANWVRLATSKQVRNGDDPNNDWNQGYGFQFWRCRNGAYRGDGAFGQNCIVMPDQDAVVATTAGLQDLGRVLHYVWTILQPAMQSAPLAPSHGTSLPERLAALEIAPPVGAAISPLAAELSGKTYEFGDNPAGIRCATVHFDGDLCRAEVTVGEGRHELVASYSEWRRGMTGLFGASEQRYAARFAWSAPNVLLLRLSQYETQLTHTVQCRFDEDRIAVAWKLNAAFFSVGELSVDGIATSSR